MTPADLGRVLAAENLRDLQLVVGHVDSLSNRLVANARSLHLGGESPDADTASEIAGKLRRIAAQLDACCISPFVVGKE
jgi:hypothetical protein